MECFVFIFCAILGFCAVCSTVFLSRIVELLKRRNHQ
jgi:hypothetical protein